MLTLDETGRLVGGYAWVELRLFEVVGAWAPVADEAEVAAVLAAQSRHHAWHAELLLGHRPVVAGGDADALVAPPGPGAAAALAALSELTEDDAPASVERLAGLYRALVPRLVTSYTDRLDAVSPVADPALRRTLRLVIADEADDWREGERLLQSLLRTTDDVARAAEAQAHVESALVAAGGLSPA